MLAGTVKPLMITGFLWAVTLGRLGNADERFAAVFPITVGGRVLQLREPKDDVAAPALGDWDGDGRRDLLVGQNSGRMRVFHNGGTDEHPQFSDPAWFDDITAEGRIPVG